MRGMRIHRWRACAMRRPIIMANNLPAAIGQAINDLADAQSDVRNDKLRDSSDSSECYHCELGEKQDMKTLVSIIARDRPWLTRFRDGRLLMVRFGGKGFEIVNDDRTLCGQLSAMETFRRIRSHATRRGKRCWACFDMALTYSQEGRRVLTDETS
jgi:hypothetical protein